MLRGLLIAVGIALTIGTLRSQQAEGDYRPVAPPTALHHALLSNLKQYEDWVNDGDFASAAGTAKGVVALAQLYGPQVNDAKRIAALVEASGQLATAAAGKDAAACKKAIGDCQRILTELASAVYLKSTGVKGFKPPAATKTWMLLMDAAYADAKFAKTPQQFGQLAYVMAEEANVAAYLRNDAAWRKHSFEVRDAALQVASQSADLAAAKKKLKEVYNRCEACHQRYQK